MSLSAPFAAPQTLACWSNLSDHVLFSCSLGLRIVMADVNEDDLKASAEEIAKIVGQPNVLAVPTDVSQIDQVERCKGLSESTNFAIRTETPPLSLSFSSA